MKKMLFCATQRRFQLELNFLKETRSWIVCGERFHQYKIAEGDGLAFIFCLEHYKRINCWRNPKSRYEHVVGFTKKSIMTSFVASKIHFGGGCYATWTRNCLYSIITFRLVGKICFKAPELAGCNRDRWLLGGLGGMLMEIDNFRFFTNNHELSL
jgi:hypothetical protein